jgi:ubiquinone/menaquinone biosynthesis C-methylase UbiE
MKPNAEPYVHALRFRALTRFYDRLLRMILKEDKFRNLLVAQAAVRDGERVLDLGCGTGTLTLLLKRSAPDAQVVGLDGDLEALAAAQDKADREGIALEFVHSLAWEAPFEPASFDRAVSSLVFHHLTTENKRRTLRKLHGWLKPGGELHVADWGFPHDALMRLAFLPVQLLDGFETTSDSVQGLLEPLMREVGFVEVAETHRERTLFGTLSLYRARQSRQAQR